jgi:FlaA1/EpsC-like NDP-sugar epimerase
MVTIAFALNKRSPASRGDITLRPAMWSMVMAHLQLIFGLVLYIISPKVVFSGESMRDPVLRFFLVEHILVMLMAVTLITIGYIRAKKAVDLSKRNSNLLLYFIISLLLILSRIPWPFLSYGGKWI